LVNEVADRVDRWSGHTAWTVVSGSPAAAERPIPAATTSPAGATTTQPAQAPAPAQTTAPAVTSYRAGKFRPKADHGITVIASDGDDFTCEYDSSYWCWKA
jgi:hypothetical protein